MLTVRAALGAAAVVGGLLLPLAVAIPPAPPPVESPCTQAEQVYGRLAARQPAGPLGQAYEVAIGGTVYGPVTGLAVPWPAADAWAAAHPESGVGFCDPNGRYTLVGLAVRGGWAYVLIGPGGRIEKIYLSQRPLTWD